ncbi:hypothetical protein niasHT_038513 [Heterodera trifolii]|uniref:Uncharacterized protein n=1 Tax=Heterodera trifolii TaxID=157864 RepID=A0ABD2IR17_9BILA
MAFFPVPDPQPVTNTLKPLQHEQQRYAAHIPLSGRQSTTSCESANSGTQLDSATRRLDQMIDQARYRHSQHRNKFKEAIDYLDHIFEDFQREAADAAARPTANGGGKKEKAAATTTTASAQQKHQQQPQQQKHVQAVQDDSSAGGAVVIEPVQATFRQGSVKSAKEAFEKVAAAIASDKQNSRVRKQPSVPTSSSSSSAQQQQQKPAKVPLRSVPSSSFPTTATTATATVAAGAGAELADVEVAETIVLPSKHSAERLDFTKHWVSGGGAEGGAGAGVAVWAQSAPHRRDDPLLGIHGTESSAGGYDSDEHSLGSCSAEVAAINAADQQRRRRHNQQQQQAKKKAPVAPAQQQKAVATVATTASAVPSKAAPQHHQQHQQQQQQQRYAKQANANGTAADRPMLPQIVAAPSCATSRPQPFRPQPQLGVLPPALVAAAASTSGCGDQQQMLQKVPSIEQLRLMRSSQERAGSQDYHSMASSVHSQDGFRPAASCLSTLSLQRIGLMGGSSGSGAFHSYTPTTAQQKQSSVPFQPQPQQYQLKGSIQSLPDSALCTAAAAGLKGYGAAVYSQQQPSSFGTGITAMAQQQQQQKQPVNGIATNHRQFATLARMDSSNSKAKQGTTGGGSSTATTTTNCLRPTAQRLLPATATTTATTATTATADHASAIDALVAELELNTADTSFASAEKRRSFPTMQTEVASRTKPAKIGGTTVVTRQQLPSHNFTNRPAQQENGSNRSKPLEKLNELIAMDDESSTMRRRRTAQQQQQQAAAASSAPAPPAAGGNRPFDTINQEKLNPSKVDAMARMFNGKQQQQQSAATAGTATKPFTSGGSTGNNATSDHQGWATRRAATIGGGRAAAPAVPSSSVGSTTARHGGDVPPLSLTNGHHAPPATATTARQHNQQQHSALKKQYTLPAMASVAAAAATMAPLSSRIYRGNGAAAGLLELGGTNGRCRTNGTGRTTTAAAKRDGAGTPTVVDDDHGGGTAAGPNRHEGNGICAGNTGRGNFYDNVQSAARNGRCGGGRTSPAGYSFSNDSVSLCSQSDAALPPATSKGGTNAASNGTGGGAGGRIGQLIRKLGSSVGGGGGSGAKVPSSATSTLSLNRVFSNEMSSSCVGGTAPRDDADGKNRTSKAAAASCAAATIGTNGNGTLTKSTSLSGDPWRYQVMMAEHQQQQQNGGGRRMEEQQSKQQLHQPQQQQQNGGIGNRLKQTIFGSAIRRRVPT